MPLSFDDGTEAPAPPREPDDPNNPNGLARGQLLYDALVGVVADSEEAPLFELVAALRSGIARNGHPAVPWPKLGPAVQRMLADLDERLFDDGEG
jgi:hypothetical protein